MRRGEGAVAAVLVGLLGALVHAHALDVDLGPRLADRLVRHAAIVSGSGKAPWGYRILAPRLVDGFAARFGVDPDVAVAWGYVGLWGVATGIALFAMFAWLRAWVAPAWAFAGAVWFAAMHPPSFRWHWFAPDSPLDLAWWLLAALATRSGHAVWLFPGMVLAVANRETALFAALIHGALAWGTEPARATLLRAGALAAVGLGTYAAVRLGVGPLPAAVSASALFVENRDPTWALFALGALGSAWALWLVGFRRRPAALQRLAIALSVTYLPAVLVFGRIRETRLFLPLLVAWLPLALDALRERFDEP